MIILDTHGGCNWCIHCITTLKIRCFTFLLLGGDVDPVAPAGFLTRARRAKHQAPIKAKGEVERVQVKTRIHHASDTIAV